MTKASSLAPQDRQTLEVAVRNGRRLQKLVNSLLDFARIEADRAQVAYESVDLAVLTANLASAFRSVIEQAGLRLAVDCPPLDVPVYVDREMWEKIVLNLLSNAFKFTFEGEIGVNLKRVGEAVELSVKDTGVGIREAELSRIFERFYRVEGARGRTMEGTSIGLALVHDLVGLHGGSIRADSKVGEGSVFTVSIPTGKDHLPPDRINADSTLTSTAADAGAFVDEAQRWLPGAIASQGSAEIPDVDARDIKSSAGDSTFQTGEAKARILLADDNADMRDYVNSLLSREYEVVTVGDGEAALAEVRRNPPDLLLSDIMMPRLDGLGLLRALRGDPATSHSCDSPVGTCGRGIEGRGPRTGRG